MRETNLHWVCNCPPAYIWPFTKKSCDDCGMGRLGEIKQCPVCDSSFEVLTNTHTCCDKECRKSKRKAERKEQERESNTVNGKASSRSSPLVP